jgi:2,3-bisphosphoglycerate-independent phosphoglycerate mutase
MSESRTPPADGAARPLVGPFVLCILDGWGEGQAGDDNAIALAHTPNWDRFRATGPMARLQASAGDVGLPEGQMGNSEVGHMNLGGGRVVMQSLPRIAAAIADGSLARQPALTDFIARLGDGGGTCHLMGLLSPGGVHSHQDHMAVLARLVGEAGVPVAIHAFLDGRDTPPASAVAIMRRFLDDLAGAPGVAIATVSGRYYAMDRDQRWERIELATNALVDGRGEAAADPIGAIEASYARDVTDEFVLPTVIGAYAGMKDGDGLLMANFRADRARQILDALTDDGFTGFGRQRLVAFGPLLGLVEYSESLARAFATVFQSTPLDNVLGQVIADAGLRQLRIAETEKYAHVTFFLNGGREAVFPGEERILVPSPKVATYDEKPEMSAFEITERLVAAIEERRFRLVVVNYANSDMVGHTGKLDAAIKAAEAIDTCLGRLAAAIVAAGGILLVTADHGNAEVMRDAETGQPHTAHTLNPVPLVLVNGPPRSRLANGCLADVAPTILHLMGLTQPAEMTGRVLVAEDGVETDAVQ